MSIYKTNQKGLTLIELMIAMAISVTLLGGLIEVYLGSKQSYNLAEESSRLQENGRFSMDLLTREIRGADFWGCLRKPDDQVLYNNLNTASAEYDPTQHGFGESISGTDGANGAPDSINIGGAFGKGINITKQMVQASAVLFVSEEHGLEENDIIILSDCSQGDIFQVTNINANGTLVHNSGNVDSGPGNLSDNCDPPQGNKHCLSKSYGTDAQIYEIRSISYDIRAGANGANGLFRIEDGNAIEVIENVENMQILYGENTDNDRFNTPNQYVNATDIGANFSNAISVRIALLLKGERDLLPTNTAQNHRLLDITVATNDKRLYRIFTTTITVRNRALVDNL